MIGLLAGGVTAVVGLSLPSVVAPAVAVAADAAEAPSGDVAVSWLPMLAVGDGAGCRL